MQLFLNNWVKDFKKRNGLYSTKEEEKCFAWGRNVFPFLPLYSLHHCLNGRLPWRHRGPFAYWLQRWSQSDEESREQMLPELILLSPVSSVSTFTFVSHCSSPPLRISTALWFLSSSYSNSLLHRFEHIIHLNILYAPVIYCMWVTILYLTECRIKKQWWVWYTLAKAQALM